MKKTINMLKHPSLKKYFFNTNWLMLDKALRLFLGLFVGVLVARYLGPKDFGVLNFGLSFVGLFGAFGKLGLDGIIVRNIVNEPKFRDEILGTSFVLRILGGILLVFCVYLVLCFTTTTENEKTVVMIIAFGQLFSGFEILDCYFQSQIKAKYSGLAGTFALLVSAITRIYFILSGLSLVWFAYAVIVEQSIKCVFLVFFYFKNKLRFVKWRFSFKKAKSLLKNSYPLMLSGFVAMIYMRIDQVMIKGMLNNESVGQYAVAVRISEVWFFVPFVIIDSLAPSLYKSKKISNVEFEDRINKLYSLVVWISILFALTISIFSEQIITILFGSMYSYSIAPLLILAWGGIFVSLSRVFGIWLIGNNLQAKNFYRTALGAALNVFLNMLLIGKFGINGCAVSTVVSLFVVNIIYDLFDRDTRGHLMIKISAFNPMR